MEKYFVFLGLIISIGISTFLLINRNKSWCTNPLRFCLTGLLFLIGLTSLLFVNDLSKDLIFFFNCLLIPFIHSLFDKFFRFLSFKIHTRDFLLYIRGSEDLDSHYKNPELKSSDYVFSILLLILLFSLPLTIL